MQSRVRRPLQRESTQRRHKPDYWLLLLSVFLLSLGLIVVYAISPGLAVQKHVSDNYYVSKQLIAIALGVVAFVVTANLPTSWWQKAQKPLAFIALGAALAVRVVGEQINGAYRWIQIGGFSFQAAELVKLALVVGLAGFLYQQKQRGELGDDKKTLKPLLILLAVLGLVVAKIQSDLGSTGVMVMIMASMVYIIGLPLKRIMTIGAIVAVGTLLLISSTAYRRQRLSTFLHPASDCQTTGYQSCQALIAVGSGGMFGMGIGKGVQAYGYLPEAANDSIFAILAEKFGFVGVITVLGLFLAFFSRLKNIIERTPDEYGRLLVTGILAWLSTQVLINVGAMIGLLPLKGITLPFISSGGTSLLFITGAVGIAFQVSRYTTYSVITNQVTEQTRGRAAHDHNPERRRFRGAYHSGSSGR